MSVLSNTHEHTCQVLCSIILWLCNWQSGHQVDSKAKRLLNPCCMHVRHNGLSPSGGGVQVTFLSVAHPGTWLSVAPSWMIASTFLVKIQGRSHERKLLIKGPRMQQIIKLQVLCLPLDIPSNGDFRNAMRTEALVTSWPLYMSEEKGAIVLYVLWLPGKPLFTLHLSFSFAFACLLWKRGNLRVYSHWSFSSIFYLYIHIHVYICIYCALCQCIYKFSWNTCLDGGVSVSPYRSSAVLHCLVGFAL